MQIKMKINTKIDMERIKERWKKDSINTELIVFALMPTHTAILTRWRLPHMCGFDFSQSQCI
jgi:hypothetical protein